jgi:phenylpyruvate tautomerase PptA (4-oxalocrotonate tautomerase family)
MLSYAGLSLRPTCRRHLPQTRRAMPQLNLNFTDIPIPESHLWEQLDDDQKQIVIETLARLIIKAARANNRKEQTND